MKVNQMLRQKETELWNGVSAVVLLCVVGGLSFYISSVTSKYRQSETSAIAVTEVDKKLVDDIRGAIPVSNEAHNHSKSWISWPGQSQPPATSLSAYQIAIANPEGVRLKTIVTR